MHKPPIFGLLAILLLVLLVPAGGCSRPNATSADSTGGSESVKESPSDLAGTPPQTPAENDAAPGKTGTASLSEEPAVTDAAVAQKASDTPTTNSVAEGPTTPGDVFQPQSAGIVAPTVDPEPVEPSPQIDRTFTKIESLETDDPQVLTQHLSEIDTALKDLVLAGSNDLIPKEEFIKYGKQLGEIKLLTGQTLANSANASEDQKKTGVLAQLIALSHMSGLGDVQSAKDLESLARGLSDSGDADLAHQSRVVLLGFELQALQNGQESDPNNVLSQVEGLFTRPEDRTFPEFMIVQQAIVVLDQMGFDEGARRARDVLVEEYQNSPDGQLRSSAWGIAVQGHQALQNYNQTRLTVVGPDADGLELVAAARGLFEAFPNAQTLEEVSRSLANIEYSGATKASQLLAEFLDDRLETTGASAAAEATKTWIDDHKARMNMVGKPIDLLGAESFDGREFDWSPYEGKVVLIDFWASWCVPCLKEIPNLRNVYEQFSKEGLEIIGVNMDDDLENAKNLIESQRLPWANYRFADALGFKSNFAQQHGIKAIPFLLLVGKDGKVQELHVRGERLIPAVRTALGMENSLIP